MTWLYPFLDVFVELFVDLFIDFALGPSFMLAMMMLVVIDAMERVPCTWVPRKQ